MRFLMMLCAALCLATTSTADTIDQLAAKSEFVRINIKSLKRNRVVTAYAGTKAYCPSVYWWSIRAASDDKARSGYRKTITREMKMVGFPTKSIAHCVDNSGFTIKGLDLQSHPKNKAYKRFVQAGVMAVRKKGSGTIGMTPVMVETNSFGTRSWAVYDASFRKICTITGNNPRVKISCNGYGALSGNTKREKNRSTFKFANKSYDMMFMTLRAPSYVKTAFGKSF